MHQNDQWRASDWKEAIMVIMLAAFGAVCGCTALQRASDALDENRDGIKRAIDTTGEIASTVSKMTADLASLTGTVRDKVDSTIDALRARLDAQVAEIRAAMDKKPDERTLWESLLAMGGSLLGIGGARHVASVRKKRRHNERIYGRLDDLERKLTRPAA